MTPPQSPALDDAELWTRFTTASLPDSAWTHREHLRVAWMYLERYDLDAAHVLMRVAIIRLNAFHGLVESAERGYHETLTRVWLVLVAAARRVHRGEDSVSFIDRHAGALARDVPLRHYARDRLFSTDARARFVEPDVALPLPRSSSGGAPGPLGPVTLSGRSVRLVPLELAHAEPLLRAADASRATYALQPVPTSLAGMHAFVATALAEQERGESLPFAVCEATGGLVVGTSRFLAIERWTWPGPAPEPLPAGPDVLEIGWTWYAERVQRTGVNTEAKLLLCTHAFETLRVRRVSWKTDARNARSRAAILRLGAAFDGVLRAHKVSPADGTIRDTAYYSMLASEWPAARRALEERLARATSRARTSRGSD